MALTEIQQSIYDKIYTWTEYAHGVGVHLVSANYYYSWLVRTKLAETDTLNAELRKMVNDGTLLARTVLVEAKTEAQLYDANQDRRTATILALPDATTQQIVDKYAKKHTKTRK